MKKRETPNAHIGQLKSNLPGHWPIEPAPIVCNPSGASEPGPYSPPTVFFLYRLDQQNILVSCHFTFLTVTYV